MVDISHDQLVIKICFFSNYTKIKKFDILRQNISISVQFHFPILHICRQELIKTEIDNEIFILHLYEIPLIMLIIIHFLTPN